MTALAAEVRDEITTALHAAAKGFSPVTALTVLKESLPASAVVTADVGSHLHLLGQMWDVPSSGKLIMTNGWSSMGFGVPAALAAALVSRENKVVCITGDGGFLMHAGEIITARRYGLKIIVVVFSDGELNLIRLKQSWKNASSSGTSLYQGALFCSDTYLGIEVISVRDAQQLQKAVGKALQSDNSVIIEAFVDPSVYSELVVRS
jgi:acetolactate synthase I/II/III large subunit